MRRTRIAIVSVVIALLWAASSGAQTIAQGRTGGATTAPAGPGEAPAVPLVLPPRDTSDPLATGTSTLRGRVTAADDGRPLRRALVRVSSPGVREARTVTTDQNGRWELKDLPADSYTVSVSRSGYVMAGYRQPKVTSPPRAVAVTDRETRENIDVALMPGGVIVGRIVDEFGEPVADASVSAHRLQFSGGVRRPVMSVPPSSSNDIGEFRLFGLQPGAYYVSTSPRSPSGPFDAPADRVGYGQTWYPSATDLGSAQRVMVTAGETVSGVVIALSPARTARISGTVIGADGAPLRGGSVMLAGATAPVFFGLSGMIRPDGSFTVSNVAPGEYTLRATGGGGPGAPGQMPSLSTADVLVNGTDVDGVIVQPLLPTTISGRLVGDPAVLAKIDPSRVRLMAARSGPQFVPGPPQPPQPLAADFSFSITAAPGPVIIRPVALPGLIIRSVRLEGRDVTRGFVVPAGAPVADLEVEVTMSTARLVISASNERGDAAPDHEVIVFSQDENQWGAQIPGHGATGRMNEKGTFETEPLLPGAYYVVLADDIQLELGDANDPEILASLRARAQRVTLGAGETAAVQLRASER